jgi:hypothetical protein
MNLFRASCASICFSSGVQTILAVQATQVSAMHTLHNPPDSSGGRMGFTQTTALQWPQVKESISFFPATGSEMTP